MDKGNARTSVLREHVRNSDRQPPEDLDRYAGILHSAMDAIIVTNSEQAITVFNSAAERMFLHTAAAVIGKPISILIPPRFREGHKSHVQDFGASGITSRVMGNLKPLAAIRADGQEFQIEASISQLESKGERFFTVIVRDVSERFKAEANARRLSDELKTANQTFRDQMLQRHLAEAALLQAHEQLKKRAEELEKITSCKALLTEMGEFLQSCVSSEEARLVTEQSLRTIFPRSSGIVYLNRDLSEVNEIFAKWNDANLSPAETIEPNECWGLRRGRPHAVNLAKSAAATKCAHLAAMTEGQSICIPMHAQGRTLGLFHMILPPRADSQDSVGSDSREKLPVWAAETLAFAIANVRLREKLKEQTLRDPLTLLYNRRYLEDVLDREIFRARRAGTPIGIVMMDIDNFKQFNDSHGHPVGDELLRMTGSYLKANVRPEDVPTRYGGEEFALVLPATPCEIVHARAEKLREGFRNLQLRLPGIKQLYGGVSLSCGVAVFPQHGTSAPGILQAADGALYEAKRSGKDRVSLATNMVQATA